MINENERNEIEETMSVAEETVEDASTASENGITEPAAAETEDLPETDDTAEVGKVEEPKEVYAFKWSYCDQYVHDKSENAAPTAKKKGEKTKHIGIYISVMVVAFAFVLSILALSLSFDDMSKWFADDPQQTLTVSQIAEKGMPSSVAIYSLKNTDTYSAGSGFVISEYGYIVTNYHVVENAVSITVVDSKGRDYNATNVGYNAVNDVAVLYVENCKLPAVKLGDSSKLVLGETLVAIGTPGGEECAFSVSDGIVSGLDRSVTGKQIGMIQTNTPLNPGNSGGPLFDSKGNLVGIVTMKYTFTGVDENGQLLPFEGMSFALPINGVISDIESIIDNDLASPKIGVSAVPVEEGEDYFYYAERGAIFPRMRVNEKEFYFDGTGVKHHITDEMLANEKNIILTADATGILIVGVTAGLGADGRLAVGDIVTMANGTRVNTVSDFARVCNELDTGDKILVAFIRNGEYKTETITLMTKLDMINASN